MKIRARSTEYVHPIMGGVVDISGREASYQRFGVVVINARRVDLGGPWLRFGVGLACESRMAPDWATAPTPPNEALDAQMHSPIPMPLRALRLCINLQRCRTPPLRSVLFLLLWAVGLGCGRRGGWHSLRGGFCYHSG